MKGVKEEEDEATLDLVESDYDDVSGFIKIGALVKTFRKRLRDKKDVVVPITGDPGDGKSTFAIKVGQEMDPERFSLERNVLFNPTVEQMHTAIYQGLPKYAPIILDEAIRVGYRRNWQSTRNKLLNEMLALCRFQYKAAFFCIPEFSMIDSDLQKRALFWIHIVQRGVAVVMRKSRNPFGTDSWNLKQNFRLLNERLQYTPVFEVTDFLRVMKKSPNYVATVGFGPMSLELEKEYDRLKEPFELVQVVEKPLTATQKRERTAIKALVGEMLSKGYQQKQIVELTGYSDGQVQGWARELGLRPIDVKLARKAKKFDEFDELGEAKQEVSVEVEKNE